VYIVFWLGFFRERDHMEYLDIGGRKILRWIFRKWIGGIDWIDMALYRVRWLVLVKAAMNHRVP
jgi:hypothetical protein